MVCVKNYLKRAGRQGMMDQKADEFHKLVRETADSGILVIVEGSKDRKALNKLGITNVAELNKKPSVANQSALKYHKERIKPDRKK